MNMGYSSISKAFVFVGLLLLALTLAISSHVEARDLAHSTTPQTKSVEESKFFGFHRHHHHHHRRHGRYGRRHPPAVEMAVTEANREKVAVNPEHYGGGGYGHGGHGGHYSPRGEKTN